MKIVGRPVDFSAEQVKSNLAKLDADWDGYLNKLGISDICVIGPDYEAGEVFIGACDKEIPAMVADIGFPIRLEAGWSAERN
ncbi:MAG: hypothetical protein FWD29_10060 [Micrococcales bacterium]|nr:hypothetical protein [Micrococcales bacterium]